MIPFNTTTIAIKRPMDLGAEPYGDVVWEVVETGVRSSIGTFSRTVSATERKAGGEQQQLTLQLTCDIPAAGLTHHDVVLDETTGEEYQVNWAFKRIGLGLDHMTAELYQTTGLI